jgi:two-component system sensor histidine kinase KdpD
MRDAGGVHIQPLPAASVPEPQRPIGPFGLLRWIEVRERPRYRYAYVVLAIALATSISVASFRFVDLANLVMVYLLAVVIVAARLGKGPATATTVGGVATFVYIFVPEYHSFVIADLHYLPTFLIMAGVGLVVATLTSQLRAEVVATEAREARGVALYELSGDLAATEDRVSIAAVVGKHVQRTFRCRSTLIENTAAGWRPIGTVASDMDESDLQVAHQAMTERRALRVGAQVFQPLIVTNEVIGILRSDGHDLTTLLTATEQQLLASFAHSIAIALHRLVVKEQAQAASHRAEQERLRNVMLSSVSHDLRTPLASITGAITTLIDSGARVDEATRLDLMQSIREGAEALERQVRNMLDLTRLESGSMQARRDWHPVDEVVGCAMTRLDALLGQRGVETRRAHDAAAGVRRCRAHRAVARQSPGERRALHAAGPAALRRRAQCATGSWSWKSLTAGLASRQRNASACSRSSTAAPVTTRPTALASAWRSAEPSPNCTAAAST